MNAKTVLSILTIIDCCCYIATSITFIKYYDRVRVNSSSVQKCYNAYSIVECVHMCSTTHNCCKVVSYSKHVFGTCTLHCHNLTTLQMVSDERWTTFVDKGEASFDRHNLCAKLPKSCVNQVSWARSAQILVLKCGSTPLQLKMKRAQK